MYLKYVNILYLIILTCLCLKICALEIGMEQYRLFTYKDSVDCIVPIPKPDNGMPLIYSPVTNKTIYPTRQGLIIIKLHDSIRMACPGENNHFVTPLLMKKTNDIEVTCSKRSFFRFKNVDYLFENFTCSKIPVSKLQAVVDKPCHRFQGHLINIGFETRNAFIILYKICFNMESKVPIFAWYTADVPMYRFIQNSTTIPHYIKTNLSNPIDIDEAYNKQQDTLVELLQAEKLGKWYVQLDRHKINDHVRYLLKGTLISETEFTYTYEQHATLYNENTAPQWFVYKKGAKVQMERTFKRFLLRNKGKHLIVSGTYKISEPLDYHLKRCKLFLSLPDRLPVPEFFWRMDYNVLETTGIVYIGYNGAFKNFATSKQFCNTMPCPYEPKKWLYRRALYFCCSKDSFEGSFGKFDPIIFEGL